MLATKRIQRAGDARVGLLQHCTAAADAQEREVDLSDMGGEVSIVTASHDLPPFIESDAVPGDRPIVTAAVVPYTEQGDIVMFRLQNGLIEFLGGHVEVGESVECQRTH